MSDAAARESASGAVTSHVPDGEFWARFFPTPTPDDDTVYYDLTAAPTDLDLTWWQERDRAGRAWYWVVWWRGRPAVEGWADTGAEAEHTALNAAHGHYVHHPGPAALYLAAWGH